MAPGSCRAAKPTPRRCWPRASARPITGALEIHAYDHEDVLAGQGTVGREFEQDAPDLTHILVATGGGGLIGGIAAWYAGSAEIISVEPEGCPALHDALRAGQPVDAPVGGLAADSLGARQVGALMFPIAQRFVSQAVLVPDDAILAAQRMLWDRFRLVAEPGGATAAAALLVGRFVPPAGARVGVVVCGANTDPAKAGNAALTSRRHVDVDSKPNAGSCRRRIRHSGGN